MNAPDAFAASRALEFRVIGAEAAGIFWLGAELIILLGVLAARAKAVDIEDGGLADALRMLSRDYRDWLTGDWAPEPGRAAEVIGERAFVAKHRARDLGFQDIAAALTAIEL